MQKGVGGFTSFWIAENWTFEIEGDVSHEVREGLCTEVVVEAKFANIRMMT